MDERVPPGGGRLVGQQDGSNLDYTKDIEEIHYGASTSEDDEDEPRLTIDTSEDEEDDSTVENSSSSSSFSRRRKPSLTSRLKNHPAVHRGAPATSKFNPNPLHSLQQLVHSPFLNAQISAADGGINQGCKITPLIKDNRSKSNHDTKYTPENAQSLAAAAEALRNIFSSNMGAINNYDLLPTPKSAAASSSTANSVAKSKKSSNAAKRNNNTNFQRLSPVSIEVVPSLSHLLPLSQHSPPSPQTPQPAFAEKCDSNVRSTNSNRLNYIVSKLQRSATEEEHLRQLQQLQSSPEAENFKMFQQFLKSGQFQARCNNNNLEILPATATPQIPSANTINLTNSKGFRYASSNAQTRPTFGGLPSTSLPPPPPLTFKSTPNERMDFRMPPTLTVIPKSSSGGSKKSSFRRSPPPMVPIESIANFRKPLNEDNVVYRLKKLGTDIELEKNTAALRDDQASVEELAAAAKSASVTSNSNNSDKASLPFLKPIPIGERLPNDLKNNPLSKLHPPPPSLIPIKPINQFVPILPSPVTQSTISEVPIKLRKSGGRLSPSMMNKLGRNSGAKLSRNSGSSDIIDGGQMFGKGSSNDVICKEDTVGNLSIRTANPAMDFSQHSSVTQSTINEVPIKLRRSAGGRLSPSLFAKLAKNSGSCKILDGGQMAFGKGSPNDVILPSKEEMAGNVPIMTANPAMDFAQHYSRLMAAAAASKVTKKKRRRLSTKSEYTKLAHALVQAATPLPKKDEIDRPVIVPTRVETSPKEYELCDSEREIITIEPILMPACRYESEEEDAPNGYDLLPVHEDEYVDVPDNSSPPPESAPMPAPAATSSQQNGSIDESNCFMFSPSLAIQLGVLPNGRKMLSCDICSGVYHKMFSLKKHYYRNHINPKFISAKHFEMFKLEPTSQALSSNPKFHTSTFWCNICDCLFDEKHELSSHLTDHPPLALENANNSQLYMCPTCNMVFSKKRTQDRHSKKCAKLRPKNVAASSTAAKPDSTPNSGDEEGSYDNVAEETNSTTSSKNNDDVSELDDMSKNSKLETSMMCLFCELSFTDTTKRKKHVLQHHHPKRKHQPCVYCKNKTFSDLSDLLKHICEMHSKRYFGCAICKIRFRTKEDLVAHNAESHEGVIADVEKEPVVEEKAKPQTISNKNGKNYKCNQCTKVFINTVELGRHRKTAHRDSSRNNIKKVVSAFSGPVDSNEQKYRSTIITTADYETEFYRNVGHNVKYNLENCMEGRIEMQKEENSDQDIANDPRYANVPGIAEIGEEKSASLSFHDLYGTENIDSKFIQNVSRLHLATQLTMLRKANLLDKELDCPLRTKTGGSRNSTIASRLALAEKSEGDRADDEAKNENDAANEIVFTGEWIRARNYICGTCFARFNNFWDMEDHRWSRHPNVYGFYYEFVTEQAPGSNWAMKRTLQNQGALGLPTNHTVPSSSTCTKCQKVITPVSEFHKHILECGGDTTWMSMMFAAHTKRNKKWRPYGSRRRKNIARHRGLKRNIPTTPVKIIGPPRNRQKAGDTETIQRMIANLPPKRITRRVITFDDLEARPKGRLGNNSNSQSSILTRKRKESMEVRSTTTSRSQPQQQPDSKQNVTTSKTLLGTKNNTPYNNASTATSRSRHEQIKSNTATSKDQSDSKMASMAVESKPDHVRLRSEDVTEITTRSASNAAKSKPVQIETEIKEESPEPEISSVKITSLRSNKTAKSIPAKDTESSSGETATSVTTSNRHETDTNAKPALPSKSKSSTSKTDSIVEPETSPESVSQTKTESSPAENSNTSVAPTVVKITQSKNHSASKTQLDADPEPIPIRKLRSSDDSHFTHVESVFEPKKNSSRDEQSKTESKSISEVSSTLELRSGAGLRNKPLIIKIQSENKQKNSSSDQPVTIIRSDKKKKKRCTPVTSRRLAPEIPPPPKSPKVEAEETKESPSTPKDVPAEPSKPVIVAEEVEELPAETKPVEMTEKLEDSIVKTENVVPEVTNEEVENSIVAPEKSDSDVIEKSEDSAVSEKSVSEVETEISKDSISGLDISIEETTPSVKSEELEDIPVKLEKSVVESAPAPEPVTSDDEPEQSSDSIEKSTLETSSIEIETKDESVSTESDIEIETETKIEPATAVDTIPNVSVESTTTESQTEPMKTTIEPEPVTVSKSEPEEGEIDLSTIEPADEDSPALPDTSVILAAMKETMRQTDAVISSMPVAVNSSKKRKRDDTAKCKKCGVRMETSTNTAPVCENCTEIPAKKSKSAPPAPPSPPKIETFDCKVCHVSVPKKIPAGSNDDTCDECIASAAATAAAAASAAAAIAAAAAAIKVEKPTPKKCSSKMKETRIQPPPPFRCRKCDSIGLAPPDGSTFCEKCSRLQETVCLLCKSSYISDTNDKVCGKCMLAGSSKQKKRIVDNDSTPAIVTSTVGPSDTAEKKSLHCDVCKNATKTCTCKRRLSGQPDRAEVACDKCGKLWRDEENSGSSICRPCRLVPFDNKICKTPVKIEAPRVLPELKDSIRCLDCSIVVVPTLAEAIARKLCDGCSLRRDERRSSNEIRYMDTVNAVARGGLTVQRSPNVFSGFGAAADDAARTKLEDMRVEHRKEEERSVPAVGSGPPGAPVTEHKTPMKNVKLICRGCYGVFDTVSSYKYHCDNCKHRNNEKKPLLSFAKRNTKGGPESTTQTEPANGASFEILEGVQIKYVEMGGGSQSDKSEAGKEPSQIPLVVYESDTSPMKKSDSSRSVKKIKRTHSSPETIMDTIESVIKSICYDTPESCETSDDKTPASKIPMTETAVQQQQPSVSEEPSNIVVENLKPEPKDDNGDSQVDDGAPPAKKSASRSRSSKKKSSRKRRPASKRSRKSGQDQASSAVDKTDVEAEKAVKSEPIEVSGETVDEAEKSSSSRQNDRSSSSRSKNSRRSRRRFNTSTVPAGRALRSRTKFYENLNDFKPAETDETISNPVPESESMDVVDPTPVPSPPPVVPSLEEVEKPPAAHKTAPKKRKSESNKSSAKKPRPDTNNDLGFAVTKTNKTIPKNAKKASIDPKNVEQLDDHVVESASAPSSSTNQLFVPNERTIGPRKTSSCFEPAVVPVVPVEILIETKRRRSSEISATSSSISYDQESKFSSPSQLLGNEPPSRRDSLITIASSTGEFQNELGRSFFDDGHGLESGSEYTEGSSSKNPTPTYGLEELNSSGSFSEPGEGQEATTPSPSSWYTTAWDFFGQKSLGSIIDTMNEILSRPEVSSCSSDSVDLFREQMMMFQHFGGEMSAIDKQEEDSKQDEETTTFIDLDDISGRTDTKAKSKTSSSASCSNPNVFNLDCLICDRTFCNRSGLQSHMSNIHGNEGMSKNFKDSKSKQNKANQNGMKTSKHKCSHCQKVLHSKAETLLHMKEHWKTFAMSKSSDNGSHLKNSIADKLEELLLDKALMNYLKSPQETQHRNNLPLKILNQISLAKKNQFTNWKSALAQMLEMDTNVPSTTTTATDPPSPVEPPPPVPTVEPNPIEKTISQGTETSNPEEEIDGFPCPMCNKTFEYTRQRNTHLIMVHAPRQSTHKHLMDGKNNSKKGEKARSMNENCDNKVRKETAREKIFHSYLLNDSVNTVIKKESLDDSYPPAKPPNRPATSTSTVDSFTLAKNPEKRPVTVKTESLPYPSCSTSMDFPTSTSVPLTTTKITAPNPTNNVAAKPSGNDDQQSAKKKKPCRKKMSKKEMNLPAAIVKMKAEQALLQLCNSRFNRICTQ